MNRQHASRGWRILVIALLAAVAWLVGRPARPGGSAIVETARPRVFPDLDGVTLPPNIAPPGLRIDEPGRAWQATLQGPAGTALEVTGRHGVVHFPRPAWQRLLEANRGGALSLGIAVRDEVGWRRFAPLTLEVAPEPIDRYLVYRWLTPLYNWWSQVGIYQRDLTSYENREVINGRQFDEGCVNCHVRPTGAGQGLALGFRSDEWGNGTLIDDGRDIYRLEQPVGYGSWHPDGLRVAWSINKVRQFFHLAGEETREVLDLSSGIGVYDLRTRTFQTAPALAEPGRLSTYPCWSPDGRWLYYAAAPRPWEPTDVVPPPRFEKVRYALMRIAYDPATGAFGEPEPVAAHPDPTRSCVFPRVSPDGRWLLYTSCDFGCFPIHHPESELRLLDLRTGAERSLTINSARADTWHSWSRNGRWIAFASKRADGLFTKVYLSYFDTTGEAHKPLLLPQRDPEFYDTLWCSYNVPELYPTAVPATAADLGRALRGKDVQRIEMPSELVPRNPAAMSPPVTEQR